MHLLQKEFTKHDEHLTLVEQTGLPHDMAQSCKWLRYDGCSPNQLQINAAHYSDIFIFVNGSLVFWNVDKLLAGKLVRKVRDESLTKKKGNTKRSPYSNIKEYSLIDIKEERETFIYSYVPRLNN